VHDIATTPDLILTEEDLVRKSAEIAAIVDGSGISDVISSFTYPICSAYGLE
jgi:hypothetical protein